jgi:MIP family channel proteins
MDLRLARAVLADAAGAYALTFVTAAVACTDVYTSGEVGLLGHALAQGLILAAVIIAIGRISGAHVNPAVTLAALLVGRISPRRAAAYVVAQLAGAVIAALMVAAVYAPDVWGPVALGTPMLGPGVAPGTGVFVEAALAFVLVLTMLVTTRDPEHGYGPAGMAVGAVLAASVLVAGPLTGAALNPARSFGPAIISGHFADHQVYWLGPLLGAVVAAVFVGLFGSWRRNDADPETRNDPGARGVAVEKEEIE